MTSGFGPVLVPLHGIGGRQDLPLPFSYVLVGAAVALVASFVILGLVWPTARYTGQSEIYPLPDLVSLWLDSAVTEWLVRGLGLALSLLMAAALVFGPDLLTNPVFGFLYVWVWVGLVPVSLLFGPVWRWLNPLRTLHLLACRVTRRDPDDGVTQLPAGVGVWPAAAGLFGFVWLELVAPDRVTRPVVLLWLTVYVLILLVGSVVVGQRWFAAADPFEAYASLVARLSPWCRDPATGLLAWRRPLANLATLRPRPGLVVFVSVLLGSTAYDGFSNSSAFVGWLQNLPVSTVLATSGLLTGFAAAVFVSYTAATLLAGRITGDSRLRLPGQFVHTLLPIALGYVTAHYLTLLIIEGQRTGRLISDPFGLGWNLFGTAELGVNLWIVNQPTLVALAQAGAVVGGHILGVVTAHDRALALFPRSQAVTGQLPLLAVMVGYTVTGLWLLFSI